MVRLAIRHFPKTDKFSVNTCIKQSSLPTVVSIARPRMALPSTIASRDEDSSVVSASTGAIVQEALKTAAMNDYRKRLRSAGRNAEQIAGKYIESVNQASNALVKASSAPIEALERCRKHLVELDADIHRKSAEIGARNNTIVQNLTVTEESTEKLSRGIQEGMEKLNKAVAAVAVEVNFERDTNVFGMWAVLIGTGSVLSYCYLEALPLEISTDKIVKPAKTIFLWLGSVMLLFGLFARALLLYNHRERR